MNAVLKMIKQLIEKIKASPDSGEECKIEKPKPTIPIPSLPSIPTGPGPCLGDINLLRDLLFVVMLLQGAASPKVKEQLKKIPMNKILDIVRKNVVSPENQSELRQ